MAKYQAGSELGHNNVDQSYSGSMSTLEGEMINEDGFFGKYCPACKKQIPPNTKCPCTGENDEET